MSIYTSLLNAPTSYVRSEDEAEMVELKPHCHISRRALVALCSQNALLPPSRKAAVPRRSTRDALYAD